MKQRLKKTIAVSLSLPALLLLLFFSGISIPLDFLDSSLESLATRLLDRRVVVHGPVRIRPSLKPIIELGGLTIGNPMDWPQEGHLLKVESGHGQISLLPLLKGDFLINDLTFKGVDLQLVTRSDHTTNYSFGESAPNAETKQSSHTLTGLEHISLHDIRLSYLDELSGREYVLNVDEAHGSGAQESPLSFSLHGTFSEQPISLEFKGGSLADLLDQKKSWPLAEGIVSLADTTLDLSGTLVRKNLKKGDYMWILARGKIVSRDETGKPLRFVGTHSDITQRKRVEEQLRILMRAVEQSHSTIVITDLDANIEFANPAFTRTTGYTPEEAVHQNPRILKSDEHDSAFYKSMWDTLSKGDVWQGEMRNKRKDGSLYWEFATISPVKNETGKTTHYVAIKEDITDRKEVAKQLEKAVTVAEVMSQEAETANRAKSAFLANMAHELRTPLNVILGFSRLLERGASVTADQLEKLELIHRSGDHLLALINDILDLSKIESGRAVVKNDNFDLLTFLKSSAMMFEQRAAEKLLHFSFEKDDDIPQFISTDKGKLQQILFNLLSNAISYTKHGQVTLQVSTVDNVSVENSMPEKQPVSENPDLWLRFTIRDTGIGIAPSDIDQIFKQFVQAENGPSDKGGTGLGLSISQSFATIMGSFIQVTSDKGKGSTFWFDLPVKVVYAADIKKAAVPNRPIALAVDQPVYRILVVEDHKESRLMMTQLLKMVGFEVQEAVNGKEGVELFLQFQPNLILMDINMPVMDGLAATGKIRDTKAGADIPIIALTAHIFEKEREDILAAGCDDCIAKPYDENTLFATLSHHLGAQFDYGEEQDLVGHPQSSSPREPDSEALAGLPKALLTELAAAAAELNQQRAMDCIAQIRIKDSSLADALETLAERFMFEQLMGHIGKTKNA